MGGAKPVPLTRLLWSEQGTGYAPFLQPYPLGMARNGLSQTGAQGAQGGRSLGPGGEPRPLDLGPTGLPRSQTGGLPAWKDRVGAKGGLKYNSFTLRAFTQFI